MLTTVANLDKMPQLVKNVAKNAFAIYNPKNAVAIYNQQTLFSPPFLPQFFEKTAAYYLLNKKNCSKLHATSRHYSTKICFYETVLPDH